MLPKLAIVLVLCLVGTFVVAQNTYTRADRTKIRNRYAFTADKGLISPFAHDCIANAQRFRTDYRHEKSPSIETLIELVERLEDVVANTSEYSQFNSPDKVARMILHRFHLDSVDFSNMEQVQYVGDVARIETEVMGKLAGPDEYYFPDNIYNEKELCTMLFMFSHIFLNNSRAIQQSARVRRATYQYQRSQTSNPTHPINSDFLDGAVSVNPIQEKGIVSFRLDSKEAIAPAKVLAGVIAGMTDNVVTSGKAITEKLSPRNTAMAEETTLKDPILAVTFGSLMGPASFYEFASTNPSFDQSLIYGVQGSWVNSTCCTYYAVEGVTDPRALRRSNRGSLAQIRGALDGYLIGRNLKNNIGKDAQQLKLSVILKSYYSWPHVTTGGKKYGLSYCDRRDNRPNSQELADVGNAFNLIYNFVSGNENSAYKGDLINTFVDRAASLQEFCNKRATGTLDKSSPQDTPADLIFIIDPKSEEMSKTSELINAVISRVNKIGRYAGAVSVFVNSNTKPDAELPQGTGGWPLGALVYNSTNIGAVGCQLKTETPMAAQTLLGKYLHNVNQTLFNYKWWSRKSYTGVPSKNVILIDHGSLVMPTSGADKNDFDTYKDELYWRNRDTKFLVVSPKPEMFKDFIGEHNEVLSPQGAVSTIAASIASRIADNPATLTYNDCMTQTVKNATFEGFVSVGNQYKLALYPEYFKVSSSIEFTIKATEGGIRYCYDRVSPPENPKYCKDLAENAEDHFTYWEPCEKHTVHTCAPIYITIWGKERNTLCKDVHCQALDQAKFTIGQSGAYCNSSLRLASAFFLQIICISLIAIYSFKWVSV